MSFRADLHCHSTYSDGTDTPEELIYLAKELNLQALSITDHDSFEAYSNTLFQVAEKNNIKLIPGIEISSELNSEAVHILGYNFNITSKGFKNFLKEVQSRRNNRNKKIIEKLNKINIIIEETELLDFIKRHKGVSQTTVGRPHIAQLMLEKKYVETFQEAFDKYLKDSASCYVQGEKFPPQKVIEEIHKASGKAVLAHPHFIKKKSVLKALLDMNFDGIEVYYGKLMPFQEKKWFDIAEKQKLLITGGSDYHGSIKPYIKLGCSWVNEDVFNELIR